MRTPRALVAALFLAACTDPPRPAAPGPDPAAAALDRAAQAVAQGDYALAEQHAASVKSPRALIEKARIHLVTGRYAEAEAAAKEAAALSADARADAWPVRAQALAATGRTADAVAVLRDVEGEPGARRARVLLGELHLRSGRRADARRPLMTVIDDYNQGRITDADAIGLSLVGRAAFLLRSARDANDAFNRAEKVGAKRIPETLIWEGQLFLDKYDPGHAGQVAREALALAPRDPDAHVLMARVALALSGDLDAAEREAARALEVNPRHAGAHALRAEVALRDLDIGAAEADADQGLSVDPTNLELLSMKAAARFLAGDRAGFEALKRQVLALHPTYASFFRVVGDDAEWHHRYEDVVGLMTEAIAVDPEDAKAHAMLGLGLLRTGDERAGLAALRAAWGRDKFHVQVFNTLNLFDSIPAKYDTVDGHPFRIRYPKEDRAILERYVPRMLDEAWTSMAKRWGFTPRTPLQIELYKDEQSVAVRASGFPSPALSSVTFGRTVVLRSPRAGSVHWGKLLWNAVATAFALEMSKGRAPRWLAHGLGAHEATVRRPADESADDQALAAALEAGRVPAVTALDKAFTHANDAAEQGVAHTAARHLVSYLVETFGFPKIVSILPRLAEDRRPPEVIVEVLGVPADELDRRFRAWLATRLDPHKAIRDPHDGYAARVQAARVAEERNDDDAARALYEAAAKLDPSQSAPLTGLRNLARKRGDKAAETSALERLVKVAPTDAKAWEALLDRLIEQRRWGDAVKAGEAALFADVASAALHLRYARALARTKRTAAARYELESALLCGPDVAGRAEIEKELTALPDKPAKGG
jgi:tetratricopeptide (TPR) repeat protein